MSFEEHTQSLDVLTKTRLLRLNFEPRAKWIAAPQQLTYQRKLVGDPIGSAILIKEPDGSFTVKNLQSGQEWPLDQAGLTDGRARLWRDAHTATITFDKGHRTLLVGGLDGPPTSIWVDGAPMLIWQGGQAGLFLKSRCDLLFLSNGKATQPVSLAQLVET